MKEAQSLPKIDIVAALRPHIKGEIRNEELYRLMFSTDASNYQVKPMAVLFPSNVADVQKAVNFCAKHKVPVISRGGGSSLSGQSIGNGLLIDFSKFMHEVLDWEIGEKKVWVEPGIALASLNNQLSREKQMIGPDPSSALVACIGGMAGNNSTGTHSIVYGMMADQVEEVEVVLANGEILHLEEKSSEELSELIRREDTEGLIYRAILDILKKYHQEIEENYPKTWRNVAGYNLDRLWKSYKANGKLNLANLIVGSEGTLGIMSRIKLKSVLRPSISQLALIHFDEMEKACEAVPALLKCGPSAIEFSNDYFHELIDQNAAYQDIYRSSVKGIPKALLILEQSGEKQEEIEAGFEKMHQILKELEFSGEIVYRRSPEEVASVWGMRKAGFGLMMSQRGDAKPQSFADDASVPIDQLPGFIKEMEGIFQKEGIRVAMVGHASAGCIHMNPNLNLKTPKGIQQMQDMAISIAETAIKYGGSSTGEHGEGLAKSYFNEKVYGPELHQAFREVKEAFDPQYILQPGRILDAHEPWAEDILRYNSSYSVPNNPTETILDFSKDGGYSGLVEMCNGTGFCRKDEGGVMCPSYRVSRDEKHSTRGRANALREAIKGNLEGGLSNPELYESLDLCLECKACKVECPSIVDMAKLKYEYLHQYQQKHGTPLKNRFFAHIHRLNKAFRPFKLLFNASIRNPLIRIFLEKRLGIDRRRSIPPLGKGNFQAWASLSPEKKRGNKGQLILWDDTFLTFNQPELGKAAMTVLEAVGFEVMLMKDRKCCGRPMISKGLLREAKEHAAHNVALLLPYVEKGIPIIGVEPSCIASFKDEYPDLLQNEAAQKIADASYFIEDFLGELREKDQLNWKFSVENQEITIKYHAHCYQKALSSPKSGLELLGLIPGAKVEEIPSGCCGMAGSFGYEKEHYEISMACGEEVLFPAIRSSSPDTIIAASGFSCRHQIADGVGGKAFHPIEILANFLS
ncbi:MAG: FAD-linked oxidase C-terminal domain-containing protein [Bacteroidia bacterium]|nr:FAD-linked oxidase C-terminal domain-containing protein [Bacteroidia bacterium]